MDIDEAGLNFTENEEGLRLVAYKDIGGVWTIGYGHTGPEVREGLVWTEAQAKTTLLHDLMQSIAAVSRLVKVPLTQGQFNAISDFVFNAGVGALQHSTLLRLLNAGDYAGASAQFDRWDHVGAKVVAGLLRRRQAETQMFDGAQSSDNDLAST